MAAGFSYHDMPGTSLCNDANSSGLERTQWRHGVKRTNTTPRVEHSLVEREFLTMLCTILGCMKSSPQLGVRRRPASLTLKEMVRAQWTGFARKLLLPASLGAAVTVCFFVHMLRAVFYNMPRAAVNFNDGLGGANVVKGNVIFNSCRESGDHGPINTWFGVLDRDCRLG